MKIKKIRIKKMWGYEKILVNNSKYCAKHLYIRYGYQCSFHYHKNKDETFYVLQGTVVLKIYTKLTNSITTYILQPGDSYRLRPNTIHSFFTTSSTAKFLEVSTYDDTKDSYRLTKSCKIKEQDGSINPIKPRRKRK